MDLPDFETPKITQPAAPAAVVQTAQEPAPRPPSRSGRFLLYGLAALIPVGGILFVVTKQRRMVAEKQAGDWAKTVDPAAAQEGQALVEKRHLQRVTAEYNEVWALVVRAKNQRDTQREARTLEFAMSKIQTLIGQGHLDEAETLLAKVKAAIPAVPVSNALPVAPKPIDVKAGPQPVIDDATPLAPASAQRRGAGPQSVSPTPPKGLRSTTPQQPVKKRATRKRRRTR